MALRALPGRAALLLLRQGDRRRGHRCDVRRVVLHGYGRGCKDRKLVKWHVAVALRHLVACDAVVHQLQAPRESFSAEHNHHAVGDDEHGPDHISENGSDQADMAGQGQGNNKNFEKDGERDVLKHLDAARFGKPHNLVEFVQAVREDDDVRGLNRHRSARHAHGNAHIARRKGRGIVHAVAYHAHGASAKVEPALLVQKERLHQVDLIQFVSRGELGMHEALGEVKHRGDLVCCTGVVPSKHGAFHTHGSKAREGRIGTRPHAVSNCEEPVEGRIRAQPADRKALLLPRGGQIQVLPVPAGPAVLPSELDVADEDVRAIDLGRKAFPRQGAVIVHIVRDRLAVSLLCGADSRGDGVRGLRLSAGQPVHELLQRRAGDHRDIDHLVVPHRQGASLVETQGLQEAQVFQILPPLHEHPPPGRGGQAADDRGRRGEDQGARARRHQKDAGRVDPLPPLLAGRRQGRRHDGNHNGGDDHQRRVVLGKGLHQELASAPLHSSLLHHARHFSDRAVLGPGRGEDFHVGALVQGPSGDCTAQALLHPARLPRQAALVHS